MCHIDMFQIPIHLIIYYMTTHLLALVSNVSSIVCVCVLFWAIV